MSRSATESAEPAAAAGPVRWTPRQRAMLGELGLADWSRAADRSPVMAGAGAATARAAVSTPVPAATAAGRPVSVPVSVSPPAGGEAVAGTGPGRAPRLADAARPGPVTAAPTRPPVAGPDPAASAPALPATATAAGLAPRDAGVDAMDWPALAATVSDCRACRLCEGRTRTVFGAGPHDAHWLVVGEAPGEQEDLQGEPFVGKSGQLLDAMLRALGLSRAEGTPPEQAAYIANTVKCRPPGNRNPQPDELATCEPYLVRQIALLRPRIILAMGRFAVQSLLRTDEPVGRLRGRVHRYQGVPLVVTYHPAYLLRSPQEKARAWDDLCRARAALRDAA